MLRLIKQPEACILGRILAGTQKRAIKCNKEYKNGSLECMLRKQSFGDIMNYVLGPIA